MSSNQRCLIYKLDFVTNFIKCTWTILDFKKHDSHLNRDANGSNKKYILLKKNNNNRKDVLKGNLCTFITGNVMFCV